MADSQANHGDAAAEGRRIYLGNLSYSVAPTDIETVLKGNNFDNFQNIHISIDPVSGRNPGYCFVDFTDRETAERALSSLSATVNGRELKVGPCEPKKPREKRHETAFQRWGDWRSGSNSESETRSNSNSNSGSRQNGTEQGPRGALNVFDGHSKDGNEGRTLYVGGLTRVVDQAENAEEMGELFSAFKPIAIGKRITPHESTWSKPGNFHYCFVTFETREEANEASLALDGKEYKDGRLRVNVTSNTPRKLTNRQTDIKFNRDSADGEEQQQPRQPRTPSRAAASTNWRRKD